VAKKKVNVHKMYDKYEKNVAKRHQKKIVKYLRAQGRRISKAIITKNNDTKDDNNMTEKEAEELARKILDNSYDFEDDIKSLDALLFSMVLVSGEVGNELANIRLFAKESDYQLFSVIDKEYTKYARKYSLVQSKLITDTTKKRTRKILADGMLKGESYQQISKNIVDNVDNLSVARAQAIASTEIHSSFMVARDIKASTAGFKEKKWMDSDDSVVRPWHKKYDDEGWVAIDYLWGGIMRFPGDPFGTAREVIRCRCEISYR